MSWTRVAHDQMQPRRFTAAARPTSGDGPKPFDRTDVARIFDVPPGLLDSPARLAAAEPFAFVPTRAPGPWWRRRWQWAVLSATGKVAHGRTWTEAGAYLRTERHARRWSR
ncbi:hypothetical protein AB0N38_33230 [Micromonospora aurantiaca]|uniref:hypothetical protein n=1 Tax=Micromonospora aurantiaca (nom. illeg.) TaxID=47850 RepID=UPI003424FAFB